jgi:hypothetical protein
MLKTEQPQEIESPFGPFFLLDAHLSVKAVIKAAIQEEELP